MSLKIRNRIARSLEKMISLSQTLIICLQWYKDDLMFVIISHLWSFFFLDIGFLFFFFTPRCCKVNYTIIFVWKKRMKNTGYMSHYSAAQNEGKWSSSYSEKGELFIIPQLKSLNIFSQTLLFARQKFSLQGEICWDRSLYASYKIRTALVKYACRQEVEQMQAHVGENPLQICVS